MSRFGKGIAYRIHYDFPPNPLFSVSSCTGRDFPDGQHCYWLKTKRFLSFPNRTIWLRGDSRETAIIWLSRACREPNCCVVVCAALLLRRTGCRRVGPVAPSSSQLAVLFYNCSYRTQSRPVFVTQRRLQYSQAHTRWRNSGLPS